MICNKCGYKFSDEFYFCPECGQKIVPFEKSQASSEINFFKNENPISGRDKNIITEPGSFDAGALGDHRIEDEKNLGQPKNEAHLSNNIKKSPLLPKDRMNPEQLKNEDAMAKTKEVFAAVLNNDLEKLDELITKDYDINCTDSKGRTPLMIAAFYGYIEIAMRLLESSASFNASSFDGLTALKLAEKSKNKVIYNVIKRKISDPFFTIYSSDYREMVGISSQNSDSTIVAAKSEKASVSDMATPLETRDVSNNTATTINTITENINQQGHSNSVNEDIENINFISTFKNEISSNKLLWLFVSIFFILILAHSYPYVVSKSLTPEELIEERNKELIEITKKGNSDSIKSIVSAGAEINYISNDGTPLIIAAKYGKLKTLNTLLDLGADPNLKDYQERTPLGEAVAGRKIECIISLIHKGASFLPDEKNYKEIFQYSLKNCDADLLKLCIEHNKKNKAEAFNYYINEIKSYQGAGNVTVSAEYAKFMKSIGIFENLDGLDQLIEDAEAISIKNKEIINVQTDIKTINNNLEEIKEACYYDVQYMRAFVVAELDTGVFEIAFSPNSNHAVLKTVNTIFQTKGWFEMQVIPAGVYKGYNIYREATQAEIEAIRRKNNLTYEGNNLKSKKIDDENAKWNELEELKRKINNDIALLKEQPIESTSTQEAQVNKSAINHEQGTVPVAFPAQ